MNKGVATCTNCSKVGGEVDAPDLVDKGSLGAFALKIATASSTAVVTVSVIFSSSMGVAVRVDVLCPQETSPKDTSF